MVEVAAAAEEIVETLTTAAAVVEPARPEVAEDPVIRAPGPQTCPQESGKAAGCITAGGNLLSFVLSPAPVLGRMSSPPSRLKIEDPASSVTTK